MKPELGPGTRILRGKYELLELLADEEVASGIPMLWRAADVGSTCFAKIWRADPSFPELRSIWAHEVRNLLRLGGLPHAGEVFVTLRELGMDPVGFVVVLDGSGREPLGSALAERGRHPWLADIRSARVRKRLWEGLLRVARGLSMMHAEGSLHRLLRVASIYTDLDGMCDFRLSGFEWSLRVAAGTASESPAPEMFRPAAQYSVASDWYAFGLVCAQVVAAAEPEAFSPAADPAAGKKLLERAALIPAERKLIVDLINPDPEKRMWHASEVTEVIEDLVEALSADRDAERRPLYAGLELGRDSELSKLIHRASGQAVAPRDIEGQLSFVRGDLGSEPQVSIRTRPFHHYVIHGATVDYQVRRWPGLQQQPWAVGHCIGGDRHAAVPAERVVRSTGRRIEMRSAAWVAENLRSVRALSDSWDKALPAGSAHRGLTEEQVRTVQFFRLTNQLEALLTVTRIWPVHVATRTASGDEATVEITPVVEEARDLLCKLLEVPTAAEQMRRLFQEDEMVARRSGEESFSFSDEGRLSRKEAATSTRWRYVSFRDDAAGTHYRFSNDEPLVLLPDGDVYLRPGDLAGSSIVLHRRKKAIEDLAAHRMLLDAIADPASAKRTTSEELARDAAAGLDSSKRHALAEIWCSQPLYALQGPPGTGKTTLVAAMTRAQVKANASTQLLVTAQSHSTVDNVMAEVTAGLAVGGAGTLTVRLDSDGANGIRQTAQTLANALSESDLAMLAPPRIRDRLANLCLDGGAAGVAERQGFERLVTDGAGIVFATSNSAELTRLVESGRRYDWSIVEEAGRAHGFDLALALQASHRILLIGDQRQLPAFNLELLDGLLARPGHVLDAMRHGSRYAPSLLERHAVKAVGADPEGFADACGPWRDMLPFFGTVFRRCERAGALDGEPIARRLTQQHRMHPDIAGVVAECFYADLETAPEALATFAAEGDPFMTVEGSWMPAERIVLVDVPWLQRGRDADGENTRPRYSSQVEADAVVRILSQLRAGDVGTPGPDGPRHPTIQVLSPYRAQVRRMRRTFDKAISRGRLPHVEEFRWRGGDGGFGATVDEFQGNQADIIVVSLVRNNHAKRGNGLGFLADGRRLNVLLSRAKRKLVLVGSWDFFWARFRHGVFIGEDDPVADFAKFVMALDRAFKSRVAKRVPNRLTFTTAAQRSARGPTRAP